MRHSHRARAVIDSVFVVKLRHPFEWFVGTTFCCFQPAFSEICMGLQSMNTMKHREAVFGMMTVVVEAFAARDNRRCSRSILFVDGMRALDLL